MEYIIPAILLGYIILLHVLLARKSNTLKSIKNRIAVLEQNGKNEDINKFLKRLQRIRTENKLVADKLLEDQIMQFMFEDEITMKIFLHYTRDENIAQKIMGEGFKFVNSFYKTAEPIINDQLDLMYKHSMHKFFGPIVVVIAVSNKVYHFYEEKLHDLHVLDVKTEQILTETKPEINENSDEVYLLPNQYIKGYFNYVSGDIVTNPDFNPHYDSSIFKQNLEKLEEQRS